MWHRESADQRGEVVDVELSEQPVLVDALAGGFDGGGERLVLPLELGPHVLADEDARPKVVAGVCARLAQELLEHGGLRRGRRRRRGRGRGRGQRLRRLRGSAQ